MKLTLNEYTYEVVSEIYVITFICSFFFYIIFFKLQNKRRIGVFNCFQFIVWFERECLKQRVKMFVSQKKRCEVT